MVGNIRVRKILLPFRFFFFFSFFSSLYSNLIFKKRDGKGKERKNNLLSLTFFLILLIGTRYMSRKYIFRVIRRKTTSE